MVQLTLTEFDVDALISFTSTTIDDFAVMLYFFSLAEMKHDLERSKQYVSILVSFVLGYTIVGIIALLSLLLGVVLTREWIALSGFVPLFAGIHKVYETLVVKGYINPCFASNRRGNSDSSGATIAENDREQYKSVSVRERGNSSDSGDDEEGGLQMKKLNAGSSSKNNNNSINNNSSSKSKSSDGSSLGARSHGGSDFDDSSSDDDYDISGPVQASINSTRKKFLGMWTWDVFFKHWKDPINWDVLMITLASGSDHVVIYNAMMEHETAGWQILVTVFVYYVVLVVHTLCAVALIRCQLIARIFQTYSIMLIIFLMIGTGVYILKDSVLFVEAGTALAEAS